MTQIELSNPTIVDSEKWNVTGAKDTDFKISIMTMNKELKRMYEQIP